MESLQFQGEAIKSVPCDDYFCQQDTNPRLSWEESLSEELYTLGWPVGMPVGDCMLTVWENSAAHRGRPIL